jgi:hypothetical protein
MSVRLVNPKNFITAGKAFFTIRSEVTQTRFTYKVQKVEDKDMWFVSVLSGPNNESDYIYIGCINPAGLFIHTKGSKVTPEAQSFKAFAWFWKRIDNLPEVVSVFHEGRCGRCGRKLTVPESVESGFGPECIQMVGI